jgi:hypothetical protein
MTKKKDAPQPQAPAPMAWPQPPAIAYAPPAYAQPVQPPQRVDPYQNTSAQLLQDRNATVARVSVNQSSSFEFGTPPDFSFTATGSSKREQGDRFNARTGELLSLSRAYLNLSRQLYAAGKKLIEPEPDPGVFEGAMQVMDDLIAQGQELPDSEPEDNFVGVGFYAAEPDTVLEDPTDEDVELAKSILAARADYNAAVAANEEAMAEAGLVSPAQLLQAIGAFNEAAEALNSVRDVLGEFVPQ